MRFPIRVIDVVSHEGPEWYLGIDGTTGYCIGRCKNRPVVLLDVVLSRRPLPLLTPLPLSRQFSETRNTYSPIQSPVRHKWIAVSDFAPRSDTGPCNRADKGFRCSHRDYLQSLLDRSGALMPHTLPVQYPYTAFIMLPPHYTSDWIR